MPEHVTHSPDALEKARPTLGERIVGMIIHRQMLVPTADNMSGRKLASDCIDQELASAIATAVAEEREACARIVQGMNYKARYRTWAYMHGTGNRDFDDELVKHSDALAAAIRERSHG